MGKKEFVPSESKQGYLTMLKGAFKNDVKFAYALHASLMAYNMRTWGYKALPYLPKKKDDLGWDWMDGYPCGDFGELVFKTIKIHYPDIYEGLKSDIPISYVRDFISQNLYPFNV